MLSKTINAQNDSQAQHKVANCPLKVCQLRILKEPGAEECLMEFARSKWANPNAENYCSDLFCRKFVGEFQMK